MAWKIIRPLFGRYRDKTEVSTTFSVRTSNISDPNIIAEEFCKHFTNVGKETAGTIPNVNVDTYSFLQNSLQNYLYLTSTTPFEIFYILNKMKSKKVLDMMVLVCRC